MKESQTELNQANSASSAAAALKIKRTNSGNYAGSQLDAKEQAKKLVQSGLIKLEAENKDKGFKRSCSRKDDSKKTSLNLNTDPFDSNNKITYSSINSPNSAKSPNVANPNSPFFNANKFSFSNNSDNFNQQQQYVQSPNFNNNNRGGYRKNNSFQNNFNQQANNSSVISDPNNRGNFRFQNQRPNQQQQQQQQNGVSLFVKANNVTEELLRNIFNANVPNAKVLSIDIKSGFSFVSVDSTESANNAILELNGKTFQENVYSVSLARPRKTFPRNNTYNSNPNFDRNNSNNNSSSSNNNSSPSNFNANPATTSSPSRNTPQAESNRQIINYEDIN